MYLASLIHIAALDPEGCRSVEMGESIYIGGPKHGESKPSLLSAFKWMRRQGENCSEEVQRLMEGLRFVLGFPCVVFSFLPNDGQLIQGLAYRPTDLLERAGLTAFEVACASKNPRVRMQLAAGWIERNPLFLLSHRVGCAGCGRLAQGDDAAKYKVR